MNHYLESGRYHAAAPADLRLDDLTPRLVIRLLDTARADHQDADVEGDDDALRVAYLQCRNLCNHLRWQRNLGERV